ncbi:hypothetical protein BdWA1_000392 [Babesia duncani]|uniref:Uncharacterized protein n=1 Tax=Babesia duncani TaxID=323732 RepID=A0AAD9PM91_9APIC|nr:hypothetical protein BdWA1_000392 [Babesia duncani]
MTLNDILKHEIVKLNAGQLHLLLTLHETIKQRYPKLSLDFHLVAKSLSKISTQIPKENVGSITSYPQVQKFINYNKGTLSQMYEKFIDYYQRLLYKYRPVAMHVTCMVKCSICLAKSINNPQENFNALLDNVTKLVLLKQCPLDTLAKFVNLCLGLGRVDYQQMQHLFQRLALATIDIYAPLHKVHDEATNVAIKMTGATLEHIEKISMQELLDKLLIHGLLHHNTSTLLLPFLLDAFTRNGMDFSSLKHYWLKCNWEIIPLQALSRQYIEHDAAAKDLYTPTAQKQIDELLSLQLLNVYDSTALVRLGNVSPFARHLPEHPCNHNLLALDKARGH